MPQRLCGQTVLVTGASGFIGSHLCRRLCGMGAAVHAVSRTGAGEAEGCVRWWQGDLADPGTVQKLMAAVRPEVIFHLAGYPVGRREVEQVFPSFQSNLASTVNVLVAAAQVDCRRILLAGSLEEPKGGGAPGSPYTAAKAASSAYGRMFHLLYGLPVVIPRIGMVYGPGQEDCRKLVPYVILNALRGKSPRLTSGTREVDWIYIEDVVDALAAAAGAEGIDGESFDVASGETVAIRGVVERIITLARPGLAAEFGAVADRPLEAPHWADAGRTASLIGWRATTPLEEGLRRTVEWYAGEYPPPKRAGRVGGY
ncbi:SDR family NAD(P)-dependent oxidoreductase [Geomonas sp. Red32]|uniref:NAD-dependent epimerase/dehydratase family protein n=1 Tax=Geomonas sp. Red32 TaxID=2912856 RepID=UPI00202CFCC7|nr:SDR family NAD(P)-dependent oxidoreductase [Geomonas sp. Red32]MCM0083332.1 SDR family NAD(P)-dependent oxidoreductase [Geomonas sp. Red32]